MSRQFPALLGDKADGRVIVAHLGNGSSMCAIRNGTSVASSMGFTAVDGLVMGTRTGNLDPGVLLYLMEQKGMDVKALTNLLYKQSGLLGVSGISQDMRELLASEAPEAREAVDLYCYRAAREVGSLAAAAGGIDALVFTGGIGEHAGFVRARIVEQCAWLGATLDASANDRHETVVSAANSKEGAGRADQRGMDDRRTHHGDRGAVERAFTHRGAKPRPSRCRQAPLRDGYRHFVEGR